MNKLILLIVTAMMMLPLDVSSASKKPRTSAGVKKEKELVRSQIKKTEAQVKQVEADTKKQLNDLSVLKGEINIINRKISSTKDNISKIDRQRKTVTDSIAILEENISRLKDLTSKFLTDSRRNRESLSEMELIFSSKSFYQALKRSGRMRQANIKAKNRTQQLRKEISELEIYRKKLDSLNVVQSGLLNSLSKDSAILKSKETETKSVVAALKKKGSELTAALQESKRKAKQLDDEITRLIAEESRRAAEEARRAEEARKAKEARLAAEKARKAEADKLAKKPAQKETANNTGISPSGTILPDKKETKAIEVASAAESTAKLSGTFTSNKGRLLFPVSGKYTIMSYFGRNHHEELPNIEIENSGIDILASPSSSARSVFDGVVSMVVNLGGFHNVVMVRHGEFITVYSHIDQIAVKKGQQVKAGQTIGTIYNDDGRNILHFEVRRETAKLNPLEWVRR